MRCRGVGEHFQTFFEFLDIQKIRTPKGLDWLKARYPALSQNELMLEMQGIRMLHCTIWAGGVRKEIPKAPDTSVTPRAKQASSPARRIIGRSPEPSETEAIKRYGWRDQGVLVVSADDHRLTWPERGLVRQIGSRLYGHTPRGDRR